MRTKNAGIRLLILAIILVSSACANLERPELTAPAQAELREKARHSLNSLYAATPEAKKLRDRSVAILVFPDIFSAGLLVGGSGGNGVLFSPDGAVMGYYNAASVSFGLQAGAQDFAQAMFLTTPSALKYLNSSSGWSIGVGPTVVVVDQGAATDLSTTTARADVYAFIYSQQGLMAGISIQGEKITKLRP